MRARLQTRAFGDLSSRVTAVSTDPRRSVHRRFDAGPSNRASVPRADGLAEPEASESEEGITYIEGGG